MALSQKDKKQLMFIGIGLALILVIGPVQYNNAMKKRKEKKTNKEENKKVKNESKDHSKTPPVSATVIIKKSPEKKDQTYHLKIKKQKETAGMDWGTDPFFREEIKNQNDNDKEQQIPQLMQPESTTPEKIKGPMDDIHLTGISRIGKSKFATINRKMMKEGDKIQGFAIKQIKKRSVVLMKDGSQYEIKLNQ